MIADLHSKDLGDGGFDALELVLGVSHVQTRLEAGIDGWKLG